MAVLSAKELAELRQAVVRGEATIDFDKPIINAALQAVEDWFENNKAAGSAAIDTATAPYVFSNQQKKRLFAFWNRQKFIREGL